MERIVIEVRRTGEDDLLEFEVVLREGGSESRHLVTIASDACERLTKGACTPENCLEAAFRFLLDREPKESILRRFDVTMISRYFPEFERKLPRYLPQA
jgi:hypothetical protein